MKIISSVALLVLWVLFLSTHYVSVYSASYEATWWLDILMHTWGGFLVVTTWYLVNSLQAFPFLMSRLWLHPLVILVVAMVVWELFELRFGLVTPFNYLADTAYDFLTGFSGGLVSFLLFRCRTIKK